MKGFVPARSLVRLFVAVGIDETIRARLAEDIERMRALCPAVKWVAPGNLHLTLLFLGDVFAERVADIVSAMSEVTQTRGPFPMVVEGVGYFGPERAPRVIWAGVRTPAGTLDDLQQALTVSLSALGLPMETRAFHAHITLGRVKTGQAAAPLAGLSSTAQGVAYGRQDVRRIDLMSSCLQPAGPIYTVVQTFGLGDRTAAAAHEAQGGETVE